MSESRKIIERYESNVPNGHYPECGVSIFGFDAKQNNKGINDE